MVLRLPRRACEVLIRPQAAYVRFRRSTQATTQNSVSRSAHDRTGGVVSFARMLHDRSSYQRLGKLAELFATGFMLLDLFFQWTRILRFRR
jgi:hypothetical protein